MLQSQQLEKEDGQEKGGQIKSTQDKVIEKNEEEGMKEEEQRVVKWMEMSCEHKHK